MIVVLSVIVSLYNRPGCLPRLPGCGWSSMVATSHLKCSSHNGTLSASNWRSCAGRRHLFTCPCLSKPTGSRQWYFAYTPSIQPLISLLSAFTVGSRYGAGALRPSASTRPRVAACHLIRGLCGEFEKVQVHI